MDDDLEYLNRFIQDQRLKFELRRQLRESNLQDKIEYPDESTFEALDSSVKKNSAFVKKLKTFSDAQKCQVLEEIDKLNLTKFISEVASSLIEAKLKLSDVPAVIEICTKLNTLYRDFHKHLLSQLSNYLPIKTKRLNNVASKSQNLMGQQVPISQASLVRTPSNRNMTQSSEAAASIPSPTKMRVDLRLFAELVLTGVLPLRDSFHLLVNFVLYLMTSDKNVIQNASSILILCKGCGDELLGLVPARVRQLSCDCNMGIPTSDYISVKRQDYMKSAVIDYYGQLSKFFSVAHQELKDLLVKSQKTARSKTEMSKELKELVETKNLELQKLQNIVNQFAEILDEEAPDLVRFVELDEELSNSSECQIDLHSSQITEEELYSKSCSIWDDDGTRSFYEDLLNLRDLFPNLRIKTPVKKSSDESLNHSKFANPSLSGNSLDTSTSEKADNDGVESSSSSSSSSGEEEVVEEIVDKQPLTNRAIVGSRQPPDQFYSRLSNCVNRDMIDNAAIDFIKFFNTKFGRKKLVKAIYNVQRTRLDLLPFFARLTATIHPYVPSVGSDLASQLKSEFGYLFKKKDQINIESKVKNVRFIGEFVKFNLLSRQDAIDCLKMLLSDFTHHHIEMTCNLLETCGRLLYRSTDSHHQTKLLLEQIMRKKLLISVDSKYVTMIENAYYFTNPPETIKQVVDVPPIQLYVSYLLYKCLDRSTIEKVLRKLKLLNWEDKNLAKFVINRMIEAHNVKFHNIRYFAALLAALNKDYPWIPIAVVDGVVEDIILMMEASEIQFNQRRIPMIRYFGELFNYRIIDSSLVFKILFLFITYGVNYPEPKHNLSQIPLAVLDPPENLFRIKLICDLLDTSGPHLNGSQEKKKLDCYLLFFQRYYWCKKHIYMLHPFCMIKSGNQFPASTEYLFNDTISNLRPNFNMAKSYSEAVEHLQSFLDGLQCVG